MFPIAFTHGHARTLREDEQISREKYRGHFYHGLLVTLLGMCVCFAANEQKLYDG
jgi:hypothetical protein